MASMFPEGNTPSVIESLGSTPPNRSDEYSAHVATDLSKVRLLTNDSEPYNRVVARADLDVKSALKIGELYENEVDLHLQTVKDDTLNALQDSVMTAPEHAEQAVRIAEDINMLDEMYSGERGFQNFIVENYADESLSETAIRQEEARLHIQGLGAEYMEERDLMPTVMDFVNHALWNPAFITQMNSMAKELSDDKMNMREVLEDFHKQDPDIQSMLAEEILPVAIEAFNDNSSKVAAFMHMLSDPNAQELMTVEEGFAALDITGVAGLAAGMARWTRSVARARGYNKTLAANENMNALGVRQEAVRKAMVGEVEDVPINASILRIEGTPLDRGNVDGISAHSQALSRVRTEQTAKALEEATDPAAFIATDSISSAEQAIVKTNFRNDRQRRLGEELLDEITFTDTEGGFTARYTQMTSKGPVEREVPVRFTRNEFDTFDLEVLTTPSMSKNDVAGFMLSPEQLLRGTELVERATFAGGQSARLYNSLAGARKQAIRGLNSDSIRKVDDILLKGDQEGRVFTPNELRAGGAETPTGARALTEAEIDSYYAQRQVLDALHDLEDRRIRQTLVSQDFKEVRFTAGRGQEEITLGRPVTDISRVPTDAPVYVPKRGANRSREYEILTRQRIDEMAEQGFSFVEMRTPTVLDDGTRATHMAVVAGSRGSPAVIGDLSKRVLNYKQGYVPRIYQPGMYFVRDTANNKHVSRVFDNKTDAQAWANTQPNSADLSVQIDRMLSPEEALASQADRMGGLYTGARTESPLVYGRGDEPVPRLTASQSIDAYMRHVSDLMPINEFRSAVLQRFKNTANALAQREGKASGFVDPYNHNSALAVSDSAANAWLEQSRKYINTMMRLGSTDEKHFQRSMVSLAEWMEGSRPFGERISRAGARKIMDITSKDVPTALRGAAFNATLGFYNVRQLWVQGQNAAISMSMYPTQAPRAIGQTTVMRSAVLVPDSNVRNSIAGIMRKGIDDTGDMAENIAEFYKSGLMDSILRNADFDAARAGFATGSHQTLSRVASKGRMFFNEGELVSRMISWNMARNRWKAANPGKQLSDADIEDLVKETYRTQMNMQRENAASFQTNKFTSVPMQFMQVMFKLSENLFTSLSGKGKWTKAEASKVLAGQVALYGLGGYTAGNWALGHMREFMDKTDEEIANDPMLSNAMELAHDGAWGMMFRMLGAENEVGPSGSILGMMDDNILLDVIRAVVTLGEEDVGLFEGGFGAGGSVLTRTGDAMIDTTRAIRAVFAAPSMENFATATEKTGRALGRVASSFNNAEKAFMLYKYEEVRTSRGNRIADPMDFPGGVNTGTVLARAMGFPTDIEAMYWENRQTIAQHRASINKTTNAYADVVLNYSKNHEMRDGLLQILLSQYTPIERERIQDAAITRIMAESDSREAAREALTVYLESGGREEMSTQSYKHIRNE